jgi:hypothetical protein
MVPIMVLCSGIISTTTHADAPHETAAWTARKAHFDYLGVTTRYSCYELRDKIRQVVLELGARPDATLTPTGCDDDRPVRVPGVDIKMAVPKPATGPDASAAVWKTVDLGGMGKLEGSDCELAEQIVQRVLPLFEVRNVQMKTPCVPYQLPTGALSLRLEVLAMAKAP